MLAPELNDFLIVFYLVVADGAHVLFLILLVLMLSFACADHIKWFIFILGFVESACLLVKPILSSGLANLQSIVIFSVTVIISSRGEGSFRMNGR